MTSGRTMPAYVELIIDKSMKRYEKWTNRYDKIVQVDIIILQVMAEICHHTRYY